jgi:hypothetical protein
MIAIAVAWIAFQQWKTAQLKLKMERYERRMRVYDQVIQILKIVAPDMNPKFEDLIQFRQVTTEADFLFGSEIPDYLDELVANGMKLKNAKGSYCDHTRKPPPGYDHSKVVNEIETQTRWFTDQFNGAKEKFRPYLDISHDRTAGDVNWIRGLRRIGWVVTLPLAALVFLIFHDETKVLSADNYVFLSTPSDPHFSPIVPQKSEDSLKNRLREVWEESTQDEAKKYPIEIPGMGKATFGQTVPVEVMNKIIRDFAAKNKPPVPPPGFKLDPRLWTFSVLPSETSKVRLIGLIAGSLICVTLVIQGSISVLAWVLRGFKG